MVPETLLVILTFLSPTLLEDDSTSSIFFVVIFTALWFHIEHLYYACEMVVKGMK